MWKQGLNSFAVLDTKNILKNFLEPFMVFWLPKAAQKCKKRRRYFFYIKIMAKLAHVAWVTFRAAAAWTDCLLVCLSYTKQQHSAVYSDTK